MEELKGEAAGEVADGAKCRGDALPHAEDPSLLGLNGIRDKQETQERQKELQTG